jgi:hypothetical protein
MPNKKFSRKKSSRSNKKNKSLNKRKRSSVRGGAGDLPDWAAGPDPDASSTTAAEAERVGTHDPTNGEPYFNDPTPWLAPGDPALASASPSSSLGGLRPGSTSGRGGGSNLFGRVGRFFQPSRRDGGSGDGGGGGGGGSGPDIDAGGGGSGPDIDAGGDGSGVEAVTVEGGPEPYLNIIQQAFGGYNEENSKFKPATNLEYNDDGKTTIVGQGRGETNVFDLSSIGLLPGATSFCTKSTGITHSNNEITADGVKWGMNKPEFPRFAIIDVFAARLPDNAFIYTNRFLTKIRSMSATAKQEAMPRFRPTRLIFIAGMYPEDIGDAAPIPVRRGNICGNTDEITKETSAGGGLCISFAIVNNNDSKELKFIAAKAVRYMFRYQPNSNAQGANSIGICTLDDNPCGTMGRGGASALSAHGFSFLYKTTDDDTSAVPVEFGFIDSIGKVSPTTRTDGTDGSSPYAAQLFFMNLVNDYINRKSLTAEPPKITNSVERSYIRFLNSVANMDGRAGQAAQLATTFARGLQGNVQAAAAANQVGVDMSPQHAARALNRARGVQSSRGVGAGDGEEEDRGGGGESGSEGDADDGGDRVGGNDPFPPLSPGGAAGGLDAGENWESIFVG